MPTRTKDLKSRSETCEASGSTLLKYASALSWLPSIAYTCPILLMERSQMSVLVSWRAASALAAYRRSASAERWWYNAESPCCLIDRASPYAGIVEDSIKKPIKTVVFKKRRQRCRRMSFCMLQIYFIFPTIRCRGGCDLVFYELKMRFLRNGYLQPVARW